jgi:uncharacterized protein (TIGR02453 family)
MSFTGFPEEAVAFYEGLQADNSRTFWQANKAVYERAVKGPMQALLDELHDYGPFHVFRPYNDVRFSKNKAPYKTHTGAYGESEGGAGYYVQFSLAGIVAGAGYYSMAPDQLQRFRDAVVAESTGGELVRLGTGLEKNGLRLGAISELKTAPRGYAKDHPRVEYLRRKGLFGARDFTPAKWMQTKAVVAKVRDTWALTSDLTAWLDLHVGPSTLPPEDLARF